MKSISSEINVFKGFLSSSCSFKSLYKFWQKAWKLFCKANFKIVSEHHKFNICRRSSHAPNLMLFGVIKNLGEPPFNLSAKTKYKKKSTHTYDQIIFYLNSPYVHYFKKSLGYYNPNKTCTMRFYYFILCHLESGM